MVVTSVVVVVVVVVVTAVRPRPDVEVVIVGPEVVVDVLGVPTDDVVPFMALPELS